MTASLEHLTIALADRYRLERELGQGGMATVYLAEDLKHHRQVAIKVLRPELAAVLGAPTSQKCTPKCSAHERQIGHMSLAGAGGPSRAMLRSKRSRARIVTRRPLDGKLGQCA